VSGLVDRVLLTPPPFDAPENLVLIWNVEDRDGARMRVAAPDVQAFRERSRSLESVAFMNRVTDGAIEANDGSAAHVRLAAVTENFFEVLGVEPTLGRAFSTAEAGGFATSPEEAATAAMAVESRDAAGPTPVVLANGFWRSVYGGDPAIVGSVVRLNGRAATVVAVMGPRFRVDVRPDAGVATDVDAWVPFALPLASLQRTDGRLLDQDSDNTGVAIGRLRGGASFEVAEAEMGSIGDRLRDEMDAPATGIGIELRRMHDDATAHLRPLLATLLGAATVLLLVACLNVSTLVLARGLARREELVVRSALGAGTSRIARAVLTENALLFFLGMVGATCVAWIGSALLGQALTTKIPIVGSWGVVSMRVMVASILTGLLFLTLGCAPAMTAVLHGAVLRGAGWNGAAVAMGSRASTRSRNLLVIGQVALSSVLVLGSASLMRHAAELRQIRPGFDPEGALTFNLSLRAPDRYRGPADRARLMREIETTLAEVPRVRAVGLVGALPLGGRRWTQPYGLPGQAEHEWQSNRADFRVATAGYFYALGVELHEGRTFTLDEDLEEERRVVVVDERLAQRIAPGGSAVGAVIGIPLDGAAVQAQIVGVVGHVRHDDLTTDGREAIYVPYRQEASRDVSFVVRTEGDPTALAAPVRAAIHRIDDQIPVYDVRPLQAYLEEAIAPTLLALALVVAFAGLTLLAAAVGLYGVVAYEVGRRTKDIGLRMAVGASAREVRRSVLATGLRLGVLGTAAGAVLSLLAVGFVRPTLLGVDVTSPGTWAATALVTLSGALAAAWVPARRASLLDPREALRVD